MANLVAKSLPSACAKSELSQPSGQFDSPLHVAAAAGDEDVIIELLTAGADPTAQDSKGRVPFDVCLSRGARRVFRVWREQNEGLWDWSVARVPGGKGGDQTENIKRGKKSNKSRGNTAE